MKSKNSKQEFHLFVWVIMIITAYVGSFGLVNMIVPYIEKNLSSSKWEMFYDSVEIIYWPLFKYYEQDMPLADFIDKHFIDNCYKIGEWITKL